MKVEMYEPWGFVERHSHASRDTTVDYAPQARESRFVRIRIPTVKRVAGVDLAIIPESEKSVYREIEETEKKNVSPNETNGKIPN